MAATTDDPDTAYSKGRQAVVSSYPYWDSGNGQSRYVDVGDLFANMKEVGLNIQGAAVQSDDEVWSVFAWDDVNTLPYQVAPIRYTFDPATGEISEEIGTAHNAGDLNVEAIPLEGPNVVVVGVVEDLAENVVSVVVGVE